MCQTIITNKYYKQSNYYNINQLITSCGSLSNALTQMNGPLSTRHSQREPLGKLPSRTPPPTAYRYPRRQSPQRSAWSPGHWSSCSRSLRRTSEIHRNLAHRFSPCQLAPSNSKRTLKRCRLSRIGLRLASSELKGWISSCSKRYSFQFFPHRSSLGGFPLRPHGWR